MLPRRHFNQTFPAFGGPAIMILTCSHSSSARFRQNSVQSGPDSVGFRFMTRITRVGAGERSRGLSLGRLPSVTKKPAAGIRPGTKVGRSLGQVLGKDPRTTCSFIASTAGFHCGQFTD